ncbi:MAG: glycosyltransferase family 4 protein [Lachnospiraceae bacterium]|nr:glycosyltransferase family 4 protein [Lachnospiraceae bacterium]
MKLTFVTNYLTHHQLPFCQELYERLGEGFTLVVTNPMEEERIRMGWALDPAQYPFVIQSDRYVEDLRPVIMESDAVICGGTSVYYIQERMDAGKLTFRYHERIYKKGRQTAIRPGYFKKLKEHTRYRNKPVYLLCAGAYVPADFSLFFSYPGKMLRFGYFPEFIPAASNVRHRPRRKTVELLWTGREIGWKHPLTVLEAMRLMKQNSELSFHLTMIGEGECRSALEEKRKLYDLEKEVELKDFMPPAEVRKQMLKSDIYLMSSDFEEGWGAVVNEAMNAGCAVVASSAAGSVPYLIKGGKNGMVYEYRKSASRNAMSLAAMLDLLCGVPDLRQKLGEEAYRTIKEEWNAAVAAERLLAFSEAQLEGKELSWESGPMSAAPMIKPAKGYLYCKGEG